MNRLGEAAVEELGSEISRWRYARPELAVGIVHLGLGAFAPAHLLAFTDDALERAFGPFGVCGVSLRNPGVRDHLLPQDGLYALAERGGDAERLRVIGCLREILVGPEDPTAVVRRFADPAVGLVTLTVTENGYCHDPASGGLQPEHPDIRQDLEHPGRPERDRRAGRRAGCAPARGRPADDRPVLRQLAEQRHDAARPRSRLRGAARRRADGLDRR
jgi:fructuronate reductase